MASVKWFLGIVTSIITPPFMGIHWSGFFGFHFPQTRKRFSIIYPPPCLLNLALIKMFVLIDLPSDLLASIKISLRTLSEILVLFINFISLFLISALLESNPTTESKGGGETPL